MIRKPALGLFVYAFFDPARIIDQDRPPKSLRKCYPLLDHLALILGIAEGHWTIGALIEAAFNVVPPLPTPTAPDRRRQFRVVEGGRS